MATLLSLLWPLFVTLVLAFVLFPKATYASCNIGSQATCSAANFTATITAFFQVHPTESNKDFTTYDATVIFHWGTENITAGSQPYVIGEAIGLSHTYPFENEGHYDVGYTLTFEDDAASGCSGKTFHKIIPLTMERTPLSNRCVWEDEDEAQPSNNGLTNSENGAALGATASSSSEAGTSSVPSTTEASCTVSYQPSCDPVNITATSNVFFTVHATTPNTEFETYNATLIFHWGSESVTTGSQSYRMDDAIGLGNMYQYEDAGYYQVGYTLIFDDNAMAGCSGNSYSQFYSLEMTPLSKCIWHEEMPPPTVSPTAWMSPTAIPASPTNAPMTIQPSSGGNDDGERTPNPTTSSPSIPTVVNETESCSVGYTSSCNVANLTATSNIFFVVHPTASNTQVEATTYDATVTFHWGSESIATGSQSYLIGNAIGLSNTFQFENEGSYDVGYTLTFGEDAAGGCTGETYRSSVVLVMKKDSLSSSCSFVAAESPWPSVSPSVLTSPTLPLSFSNAPTVGNTLGVSSENTEGTLVSLPPTNAPMANDDSNTSNDNAEVDIPKPSMVPTALVDSPVSIRPTNAPVAIEDSNGVDSYRKIVLGHFFGTIVATW
eukprot:CAMPEP_0183715574 /NCGR_PEP_ID=MMETSP0737-20130205/9733_1 /TAXON_ID=385413 /ORGANISM="Thalassiosira miniscula, Strain CCMP1093" /LENGTH=605 /DNA_ID=CAMNT_0025944677 /DNA_START=89 /DNA_END=1903 /DNA_ORIENTATION=+